MMQLRNNEFSDRISQSIIADMTLRLVVSYINFLNFLNGMNLLNLIICNKII